MDFIFGTLATDALKLVHHRARRRGIQHNHDLSPRDPLPGQPVTITARVGAGLAAQTVACYYTLDGSPPDGAYGTARNGSVLLLEPAGVEWDTLAWNYMSVWRGELPGQPDGAVIRYRIGAWAQGQPEAFADWPLAQDAAEAAASAYFRGDPLPERFAPGDPARGHTFACRVDTYRPPQWAQEAVIYHVFVDRFDPGGGRPWRQTADLNGICGGTLWGVRDRMDYIAGLGATCIWLSPTFVSPSHHGYDATDLERTEPRLGGDEALRAVLEAAHQRGLRVLLDLACNHISNEHPIFRAARADPTSRYRDWFAFDDSAVGYRAFFGLPSMPQVRLSHPPARDWMIGVAQYWLREFDVDGYRLDYANGPGPDFWADFRAGCRAVKADCLCLGEVVDAPDVLHTYIGRLDGCLDFHAGEALRKTYGWGTLSEAELALFIERHTAAFPADFVLPTFLDNHDMDRFLFIAGGDKAALRRAAAAQFRLPGPPIILYGTEVGLSQTLSSREGHGAHIGRTPMIWGADQDADLLAYYAGLIADRKARRR